MEFTGKVHKIFPVQELKNNFSKRDFVLLDDTTQYPQYITFQLTKDRCSLIDKYKEGDSIKVTFNLNGREWTNPEGKVVYFNSLVAWKIEPADGSSSSRDAGAAGELPDEMIANSDDMPF